MDKALRFDRITPFETSALSLGLGLFLIWFSQVPLRSLLPVSASLLVPSYLFAFAVCCALLARTRLSGAGSFAPTVWVTPCLLLLLPLFGSLWTLLKIPVLILTAFGAALLFCRWMTLCARFSSRLFLLLYCLSSLIALAGTPLLLSVAPLLHALPFLSTGLLLLAVRNRSWMPEGEYYAEQMSVPREGLGLLVFAILLNGVQALSDSQLSQSGLVSANALQNTAMIFSLGGVLLLIRLRKPLSYRTLLAGALIFWASGVTLARVSVPAALLLTDMGCVLFELSFWMLMLQFARQSPNPARMVCIGSSLIAFALIASRLLLDLLVPFGMEALSIQTGFTLFMGLVSLLFLFLPRALIDFPAPTSTAVANPAPEPVFVPIPAEPLPQPDPPADRELRLKGSFEALGLTRQESRIALLLLDGSGDEGICGELFISKNTLKFHIRNINRKLGTASRRELPALADKLLSPQYDAGQEGSVASPVLTDAAHRRIAIKEEPSMLKHSHSSVAALVLFLSSVLVPGTEALTAFPLHEMPVLLFERPERGAKSAEVKLPPDGTELTDERRAGD